MRRYVNARTGRVSGSFDTAAKPAKSVTAALKVAVAGDTIEIQDASTYREGELLIDKAITIVSSFALAHPAADPTDPRFNIKDLPELTVRAGSRSRVMRIAGTPSTRKSAGPVRIVGLRINGGRPLHTSAEPAQGAGGGIVVIDIDNVTVEQCVFTDNHTESAPIGKWPEADRIALRDTVIGLVETIITPTVEIFINSLVKAANLALALTNRKQVEPFIRDKIIVDLGKKFDAIIPPGRPNSWLAGQAFGGGAAAVWSSPTFKRCLFRGNTAQGRGAGLAVIGYGWPTIDACLLRSNRSGSTGRRDGGGIGCEISLPGKLTRNLSEANMVNFILSKVAAAKDAIGSPLSHINMGDILDYAIWLVNPLAPSPPVRGIKAFLLDLIYGRTEEALTHLLYFFATSALSRNRWDAWNEDEIASARTSAVTVSSTTLSNNWCADDGGGLYASVLSRVNVSNTKILANTAESSGGGLRFSMGSAATISNCEFLGNVAKVNDYTGKLVAGGGAMSARNVDLVLQDTRMGSNTAGITAASNVCSDHAGGALAYQADTEGALAGIPDFWTAIMVEVFNVRAVSVNILAGCVIQHNGAGYTKSRAPMGKTAKAKGGGVWFVQGEFPDAPRLTLKIADVDTAVRDNVAQTKAYVSKVENGKKIATANNVCIQNLVARQEWTESNYQSLITAKTLEFEA